MMILQPMECVKMSSLALYEDLLNDTVQRYDRSIASGAAIQTIAMKDIKVFAIPMPDEETVRAIDTELNKRFIIHTCTANKDFNST